MAGKTAGRRGGRRPKGQDSQPAGERTVKTSIRLSLSTAQRLGVESAIRRVSQSQIIEEVLGAYLKRWRLPSTVEEAANPGKPTPNAQEAAEEAA